MRPVSLVLATVLVLALAGCGSPAPSGAAALKVIQQDWEGAYLTTSDPFPSRPDLAGFATIRSGRCTPHPNAHGRVGCALVVQNGAGRRRVVRVVATFSDNGVVSAWRFAA